MGLCVVALLAAGAVVKIAWPRESFLYGDAPGEMLPATLELAGRARIVAYGPYLPLPSGNWSATAFLGFSADVGKMPFIFEADTGGAVTRGFFEVEKGGIFHGELFIGKTELSQAEFLPEDAAGLQPSLAFGQ